jgi:diguanylate cyclase (GGDEF)-like protein
MAESRSIRAVSGKGQAGIDHCASGNLEPCLVFAVLQGLLEATHPRSGRAIYRAIVARIGRTRGTFVSLWDERRRSLPRIRLECTRMAASASAVTIDSGKPGMEVSILLVDDDPGAIQLMGRILASVGTLRFATNGRDALRLAREAAPDLILLDAEMPGMSGFQLLKTLKAESLLADVPVIFITSHSEAGFEVSALDMGAADFIAKPLKSSRVLARVRTQLRVKRMSDELRRTATTDALTGVANRRQFDESLEREWLRARRAGEPVSLLMIDVDHFKLYNDLYGHPKGDDCLRHVTQAILSACKRPADLVARYGGEEFVMLLPQTPRHGAKHVAHQVLEAVTALGIFHEDSRTTHFVSVSVGIGCFDDASAGWATLPAEQRQTDEWHALNAGDLVRAADRALYSAKQAGRAQSKLRDIADIADTADAAGIDAPELALAMTYVGLRAPTVAPPRNRP